MATVNNKDLAAQIRDYVEFRRSELDAKRRELEAKSNQGVGIGGLMTFDRDAQAARQSLSELENFATWIDRGSPAWVPQLSASELDAWAFAAEHGADIPPHVQLQLDAR
jgi:hypothetical protein